MVAPASRVTERGAGRTRTRTRTRTPTRTRRRTQTQTQPRRALSCARATGSAVDASSPSAQAEARSRADARAASLVSSRAADVSAADARGAVRSRGLAVSAACVVGALGSVLHVPAEGVAVGGVAGAACAAALAARRAYFEALQRRPRLELEGKSLPAAAAEVRPAAGKGNGAFAAQRLPRHTYLGDYSGELISNAELAYRVERGEAAYCVCSGAGGALDGAGEAADTTRFSLAHTNHAPKGSKEANLFRVKLPGRARGERPRWSFYTARDVEAGEELQWTYSDRYWAGKEDEIIA